MKIIVFIKQVPGTDNVKMDPVTGTMIRSGRDNIINPLDENALNEALRIKQQYPGTKVTAVSMGPMAAMKAVREAIAMGADGGVLLSGRCFAGSDTIATARALAGAARKIGPADLILCGERATDGETGQTGPMISCLLDISVISFVSGLEIGESGVVATRIVEGGFERVAAPFPVLVSVVRDINQPGFPTLAGKIHARKADIPVWTNEELGIESSQLGLGGSPTRVVKVFSPKLSRDTRLVRQDGSGRAVKELVEFLAARDCI